MIRANLIFPLIIAALTIASCTKEECAKTVPELTYSEFRSLGENNFALIHRFRDCDGNIGLGQNDYILTPEGDTLEVNFLIDYYFITNGDTFLETYFDSITGEEGIGLNSKIPILPNDAASDILEGEIEKRMNWFTDLLGRDTLFFRSTLYDNDGNASDVVESPVYVITQ